MKMALGIVFGENLGRLEWGEQRIKASPQERLVMG